MQAILTHAIPRAYDYEIAWSLWIAFSFEIKVPDEIANLMGDILNPLLILMVLHLIDNGLLDRSKMDKSKFARWRQMISEEALLDENWLLAYEISVKGWLKRDFSYVNSNTYFKLLKDNAISFYDDSLQL